MGTPAGLLWMSGHRLSDVHTGEQEDQASCDSRHTFGRGQGTDRRAVVFDTLIGAGSGLAIQISHDGGSPPWRKYTATINDRIHSAADKVTRDWLSKEDVLLARAVSSASVCRYFTTTGEEWIRTVDTPAPRMSNPAGILHPPERVIESFYNKPMPVKPKSNPVKLSGDGSAERVWEELFGV